MISPSHPPLPLTPFWASYPTPSPTAAPPNSSAVATSFIPSHQSPPEPPSRSPISFSPPLIAMVAVVAAAFLVVFYSRPIYRHLLRLSQWRRRRRLRAHRSASSVDFGSPTTTGFFDSPLHDPAFHYSYGLDDAVIKTIPLSLYTSKPNKHAAAIRECAVCLLEFEENDYVRTLPACSHAFHVDCIDIWLRSHANCPLCRAAIFRSESLFVPMMAARIRPSLDEDPILRDIIIEETVADLDPEEAAVPASAAGEITEEASPRRVNLGSDDRFRDFMLKRSYSFSFERSIMSERMLVTEPVTASPWRYRRGGGGFWSKRLSPFGSLSKPRVFSFQYYRGMKSPFFRRRGLFPLSESSVRFSTLGGGGGGGSSRRSKSLMSPMFTVRSGAVASSSRLRCGDPEALLSPERFNRR